MQDRLTGKILTVDSLMSMGHQDYKIIYDVPGETASLPDGWQAEPIPLTDKWLTKLGVETVFTNSDGGDHYYKLGGGDFLFSCEYGNTYRLLDIDLLVNFEFVHQLQNLYFVLMGEELTVKS